MYGYAVQSIGRGLRLLRSAGTVADLLERSVPWLTGAAGALTIGRIVSRNWPIVAVRAGLQTSLEWSDEPLWVMVRNFRETGQLYPPLDDYTGYVYGPGLGFVLSIGDAMGMSSIPQMRAVNMASALLGTVGLFSVTRSLLAGEVASFACRWLWPVVTAVLGLAILSLNVTFEALHPDNLTFAFVSVGAAALLEADGRPSHGRHLIAAGLCFGTAFTCKQTALAIFIAALLARLGLFPQRARTLATLLVAFVTSAGLILWLAGANGWQWAFRVPGLHHYEFGAIRFGALLRHIVYDEQHLGLLLLLAVPVGAIAMLFGPERSRKGSVYAYIVLGSLAAAIGAYFKVRGIWNNLYLPAVMALPIVTSACAGGVAPARRAVALVVMLGLPLLTTIARRLPSIAVLDAIADTRAWAKKLCGEYQSLTVLWPMYAFRDCPGAHPVLFESYAEVQHAALATPQTLAAAARKYGGPIVTGSNMRVSELLALGYTEDRLASTFYAWGHLFFPGFLMIYRPPANDRAPTEP